MHNSEIEKTPWEKLRTKCPKSEVCMQWNDQIRLHKT